MSTLTLSRTQYLFTSLVRTPSVLAAVAKYLPDWSDLSALLNTSRDCRNIMANIELRDLVLIRFVPAYADALQWRDMANYQDVPVTVHDIHLFLVSQQLGLHRYPTHAVRMLEDDCISHKFTQLAQAYSRFVLLLQAMVHSSSLPVPLDQEEFNRVSSSHTSRQLTFPAPLAYLHQYQIAPVFKRSKHHSLTPKAHSIDSRLPHVRLTAQPSADRLSSMISTSATNDVKKLSRKRSIFKKSFIISPPPPEEPRALRFYAGSWRNIRSSKIAPQPEIWDGSMTLKLLDDRALQRPPRCFASTNDSSDSSTPASPTISSFPLPRTGEGNSTGSTPTPPSISSRKGSSLSMSLHDLNLATCRVRAPILRVFVPCTEMEAHSASILACQKQLIEAGLWEHLSTGDIICNLGYVPPTAEDGRHLDTEDIYSILPLGNRNADNKDEFRKWLLFDGQCLVPFMPPDVVPIKNPLILPSPFYYNHLIPGSARQQHGNMRFIIDKFPPVDDIPQLELVNVARRVPSIQTPGGWVEVRKWAWIAKVVRTRPSPDSLLLMNGGEFGKGEAIEMGDGWNGKWVLEGEGTREGRQALLDTIAGLSLPGGSREWELVRERSGGGKLWLRLMPY